MELKGFDYLHICVYSLKFCAQNEPEANIVEA